MTRQTVFTHEFVEYVPDDLKGGVIYVCIPFATVVHKCACGCGREVVTPLSPTDWELIFDGQTISLDPSIGNWNYPCQSHYWIRRDKVIWDRKWSRREIDAGRADDRDQKVIYSDKRASDSPREDHDEDTHERPESLWQRFRRRWL